MRCARPGPLLARVLPGLAIGVVACKPPPEQAPPPGPGPARSAPPAMTRPPAESSPMQPRLALTLLASPRQLAMAQRSTFMVGIEVVNHGTAAVDPQLSTGTELTVNGEVSMAWSMAIGNGAHDETWYRLPPGKTATISWPLGEDLFDRPGDYQLVLTLGGQTSTAEVRVTK